MRLSARRLGWFVGCSSAAAAARAEQRDQDQDAAPPTPTSEQTLESEAALLRLKVEKLEHLLGQQQAIDAEARRLQQAVEQQEQEDAMKLLDAIRAHDEAMSDRVEEVKLAVEERMLERLRAEREAIHVEQEEHLRALQDAHRLQVRRAVESATVAADGHLLAAVAAERSKAEVEMQEELLRERQRQGAALLNLEIDVDALAAVLSNDTQYKRMSHAAQQISATVLEFEESLAGRKPEAAFKSAFSSLSAVSEKLEHPLLLEVCKTAKSAASKIPSTTSQLQKRFVDAASSGRVAALVPEGSGIWGRALASVTAALTINLPYNLLPSTDSRSPSYVISRASNHLDSGNLEDAVRELRDLRGPPAASCSGWLEEAERRLLLEQVLRVAKAEASITVSALC